MPMYRQNILRGPGALRLGGAGAPWIIPHENWEANVDPKTFDVQTNLGGLLDTRKDDVVGKITFVPLGLVALFDVLFPAIYRAPDIGASVFGASDTPCLCHSKAGKLVTFHCAALTKPPDLVLSATKTLYGQAEITALVKNNSAPNHDNSFFTLSNAALPALPVNKSHVITWPWSAAWGTTWPEIYAKDGWTVSVEPEIEYVQVDDVGTVDGLLKSVMITAKCRPLNVGEEEILDALRIQGDGADRGASLSLGQTLTIDGAFTLTINDAILLRGPIRYGSVELRAGEIAFVGQRDTSESLNGGVLFDYS